MVERLKVLTAENASLQAKIENTKVIMQDGSRKNEMGPVNSSFRNSISLSVSKTCNSMSERAQVAAHEQAH